ncbi:MAG: hypothetical protein ACLP4R_01950 [Solirubrobacteraceae bacterium]
MRCTAGCSGVNRFLLEHHGVDDHAEPIELAFFLAEALAAVRTQNAGTGE